MKTPKAAAKSPKADYTNVGGVKKLMKTPKAAAKSPKADYSLFADGGVKKLMKTPKAAAKSPKADYSLFPDGGVKKLLSSPEATPSSPQANYALFPDGGVKKLMSVPEPSPKSPAANYSLYKDGGLKKLMSTPKAGPASPKASYTNIEGVKELLKTPRQSRDMVAELDVICAAPEVTPAVVEEEPLVPNKRKSLAKSPEIKKASPEKIVEKQSPEKVEEEKKKPVRGRRGAKAKEVTEKVSEEVVEAPAKTKGKRVMDVQEADADVESPAKKSKTEATAKDLDLVKKGKRGGKTSPLSPSKTCRDNGESVEPVQVAIPTFNLEIEDPVSEKPTRGRRGKKEVVETVETVSRGRRKAAPASLKEPSL